MYRHGLLHGHLVRSVRFQGDSKKCHHIYWQISESREGHLQIIRKSDPSKIWVAVSVMQFVDDTIAAIDLFIEDLQKRGPTSRLLARFRAWICRHVHVTA